MRQTTEEVNAKRRERRDRLTDEKYWSNPPSRETLITDGCNKWGIETEGRDIETLQRIWLDVLKSKVIATSRTYRVRRKQTERVPKLPSVRVGRIAEDGTLAPYDTPIPDKLYMRTLGLPSESQEEAYG